MQQAGLDLECGWSIVYCTQTGFDEMGEVNGTGQQNSLKTMLEIRCASGLDNEASSKPDLQLFQQLACRGGRWLDNGLPAPALRGGALSAIRTTFRSTIDANAAASIFCGIWLMRKCRHPSAARRAVAQLAFLSEGAVDRIDGMGRFVQKVANTIRFEHFWKRHVASNADLKVVPSFTVNKSKHPIWDITIEKVSALASNGQVLEFGTNNGGWLHYFVSRLPETMMLHGFDCFEGLPEEWDGVPRGAIRGFGFPAELWRDDMAKREQVFEEFKRTKVMPTPPQPNIRIHSGLFSDALPRYLKDGEVPRDIRLIHFDADLYISTRPVLDTLCGQMDYEHFILFDEFYSANHEFRAWIEFVDLFKPRDWKVAATSEDGVQVLIHMNPGQGTGSAAA